MSHPEIGASIDCIDTPALVIDLDVMQANMNRMVELCRQHDIAWRPHSKANKCPQIAKLELDAGAIGVTCAKLGEAEVMAEAGVEGILVANQVVGPAKMKRLVELCRKASPILTVDNPLQVDAMSAAAAEGGVTVRLIIEVNIGLNRAGVEPGAPTIELAQYIADKPGLKFEGIMGYEGHLLTVPDQDEKRERIAAAMAVLVDTKQQLEAAGLPCPIVSAGGTGSCLMTMTCPGITELQAGGLIFMDHQYRDNCQVNEFNYSMRLLVTIVSRPTPSRAIIDAGRKSHNMEVATPSVVGHDDIEVVRLSAEHGELRLPPADKDLRVGDRLAIIPGYTDFTTVLHDEFYLVRNDRLEAIWPLAGRGKIR